MVSQTPHPFPLFTPSLGAIRVPVEELAAHRASLEAALADGRCVELVRGDTVIADIRARETKPESGKQDPEMPDFMARMKQMWGRSDLW